jgi:Dyp-type peroxidase family
MNTSDIQYPAKVSRDVVEKRLIEEKRKQPGVTFPSARKQEHLLIIRFDIARSVLDDKDRDLTRSCLKQLCGLFDRINRGVRKIDELQDNGDILRVPLKNFNFSATIGFGIGFFDKLNIPPRNRPKKLEEMPTNIGLSDSTPYTLAQTDMIVQLGSTVDYINRWVFQNSFGVIRKKEDQKKRVGYLDQVRQHRFVNMDDENIPDIITAIRDCARITDIHAGFQRIDGRNLMGFNDGISNPDRLFNNIVWTSRDDENEKFRDGTYMVFQKIEHNLELWQSMNVEKQEQWVGRSKDTGLLLGTLPKDQDRKLASDLQSDDPLIRNPAMKKWKRLYDEQSDPEKRFFDNNQLQYKNIQLECPVWSHVRKANPRQTDGIGKNLIFRRGYLYTEGGGLNGKFSSGLLFICFQKDIRNGFEHITKNFLNNKDFPVPEVRKFNREELDSRHQHARFNLEELKRLKEPEKSALGLYSKRYIEAVQEALDPNTQNTGKEGLAGPSELGIHPSGQFPVTVTIGGGYYFIPPIPDKKVSEISEQFFD